MNLLHPAPKAGALPIDYISMALLRGLTLQSRIGGARFRLMRPNRLQAVWPGAGVGGRTRTYGLLLVTEVI